MKMDNRIFGIDKALYKVYALKNGKRIATVKVIECTKFGALNKAKKHFPKEYDGYDYDHIRFAKDEEPIGVVISKNDKKRKS